MNFPILNSLISKDFLSLKKNCIVYCISVRTFFYKLLSRVILCLKILLLYQGLILGPPIGCLWVLCLITQGQADLLARSLPLKIASLAAVFGLWLPKICCSLCFHVFLRSAIKTQRNPQLSCFNFSCSIFLMIKIAS